MCGCIAQKYSYVPGSVNVKLKASPVSSADDLNSPFLTLRTRCGTSSRLTQVTVVPGATWTSAGVNEKLSIAIITPGFALDPSAEAPTDEVAASTSTIAATNE